MICKMQPEKLLERYGSPLYVYDAATIRKRCRELNKAFPDFQLYYACKANTNPEIVRLIHKEGFGIECVSPGEIALARGIGIPAKDITFTCGAISEKELVTVVQEGVRVHLDSLTQVEYFGKNFPGKDISVRLNHGVGAGHHAHTVTGGPDSKFAIDESQLDELRALAKKYSLRIIGVHQHIGSGGILKVETALEAIEAQLAVAIQFPDLQHIDFGGGFGVPYRPDEEPLNIDELGERVVSRVEKFQKEYGRKLELSFEPGRYLVAESGVLLVTVTDIKKNKKNTFVGVDSGMGHLVRPAMYDSYHIIDNVSRPFEKTTKVTVVGNYCESGDVLARDRLLPVPQIGDILVIRNAGAYGYAMSSDYNLRPRPAEILVSGNEVELIRERGK
jgi:diaminopimelate decarboxylase